MLEILQGDALEQIRRLKSESVHCCVTSPPYWGLRDYSVNGQLGLEKTPEEYVAKMVEVFREVRRVLRKDGTLWLNIADTMLPDKNEADIPHRLKIALGEDGWTKRTTIIWNKPNPMPESCTDRPTKSHEYIFLLTKSANYFYDAEAIKEPQKQCSIDRANYRLGGFPKGELADSKTSYVNNPNTVEQTRLNALNGNGANKRTVWTVDDHQALLQWLRENDSELLARFFTESRNKNDVWKIAAQPYPESHFATFPGELPKLAILAGTSARGCCPKCSAPWERMIEREKTPRGDSFGKRDGAFDRGQAGSAYQQVIESKTIGWKPTCKCRWNPPTATDNFVPVPCTVLDPFAGSGTTGQVAIELGRKAILIDLKYQELQRDRCNVTPGLALA